MGMSLVFAESLKITKNNEAYNESVYAVLEGSIWHEYAGSSLCMRMRKLNIIKLSIKYLALGSAPSRYCVPWYGWNHRPNEPIAALYCSARSHFPIGSPFCKLA
jgi:hypothetical protein